MEGERSSLYAWDDTFSRILNLPNFLKSNLEEGRVVWIKRWCNHTSSPDLVDWGW